MKVPLALDGLSRSEIELVCEVFRSGKLTMGENVKEFEELFAEKVGAKFAVMVNSGSSANLLALAALRGKVDKNCDASANDLFVAVPAVLWPTSLWPIIQMGFKALIIDTKPGTLEIDFDQLESARTELGSRLVGAVLIHPLGKSLDLERIEKMKSESNFFIVEDNCESIGSGINGKHAGNIGDFGTYSFYYSHHITTVEGGMITTNSYEYANDLLSMRAHGWTRNRMDRLEIEESLPGLHKDFLFVTPGFNFRPMEFQGALGISQISQLDSFIQKRIQNATKVNNALQNTKMQLIGCESLSVSEGMQLKQTPVLHSWMALPIKCDENEIGIEHIQRKLMDAGISSRPLLAGDFTSQPAGMHPGIIKYGNLQNSKKLYATSFMVGNHHNYSEEQIEHLTEILKKI